jgi:glutamine synthetase
MQEALDLFQNSKIARASFGDKVVDHYIHYAKTEIQAFSRAITDWERVRGFERT